MSQYEFEEDDPYVVIEKHDAPSIAPFLIGLAMGAGMALLLAPRSGAATRRDIKRRARKVQRAAHQVATNVTDGVVGTFEEARRRVEEQIDTARQAIDLKRRQVNRAMEAGRMAAQEARDELEQRIAETKAAYGASAPVARASRANVAADELDEA
jgi:gas vesicle protein